MTFTTIPVHGGELAVQIWNDDAPGRAVIALHGITASHLAWQEVAARLPETRIIAPDLRGRGRSSSLPGPWGMDAHADDVAAVIENLRVSSPLVIGHSMGAFVTVELLRRHPELIGGPLLVDGGLPLAGAQTQQEARELLGPAADRLSMTFPSREAYRDYWRRHPAFAHHWSRTLERYVDYDLIETADGLRPATVAEAMIADSLWLSRDGGPDAIRHWRGNVQLLTAVRGLQNQPVPLYSDDELRRWNEQVPNLRVTVVPDVNHYSIVMGAAGADAVAHAVHDEISTLNADAATEVRS